MTDENIIVSASPQEVDFWGQRRTLWLPAVEGLESGERVELGLQPAERDALFMAAAFRGLVEVKGWTVAKDLERRANAPSSSGGYREAQ